MDNLQQNTGSDYTFKKITMIKQPDWSLYLLLIIEDVKNLPKKLKPPSKI